MTTKNENTVKVPDDVTSKQAKQVVLNLLKQEGIKHSESEQKGEFILIRAKTNPSILSWGEDVTILIGPDEISVTAENPRQKIDWGRTKNSLKKISESLESGIAESSRPTAQI